MNALKVFEETARHDCFQLAAESLFVTQSAVSKQIRNLEDNLGVALFDRLHGGTNLTLDGHSYYAEIMKAMDIIENASQRYFSSNQYEVIALSLPHSMGTYWMNPRIEKFWQEYPNIIVHIDSQLEGESVTNNKIDISIVCLPLNSKQASKLELLFEEKLVLIVNSDSMESTKSNIIDNLKSQTLISNRNRPGLWENFFSNHGIAKPITPRQLSFKYFHMVMSTVERSLGVGFVPSHLCEESISKGDFIQLFDCVAPNRFGYFLDIPPHKRSCSKVIHFANWLRNEIAS